MTSTNSLLLSADFRNLLEEDADIEAKPRAATRLTQQLDVPSIDTGAQPVYMEAVVAHRSPAGQAAEEDREGQHGGAAEQATPELPNEQTAVDSEGVAEQLLEPIIPSLEASVDGASTLPVGPIQV